jgi:hypothetical protein
MNVAITKQEYRDSLDWVEEGVVRGRIHPDEAYRLRLGLIHDRYLAEGGTSEKFLALLTSVGRQP